MVSRPADQVAVPRDDDPTRGVGQGDVAGRVGADEVTLDDILPSDCRSIRFTDAVASIARNQVARALDGPTDRDVGRARKHDSVLTELLLQVQGLEAGGVGPDVVALNQHAGRIVDRDAGDEVSGDRRCPSDDGARITGVHFRDAYAGILRSRRSLWSRRRCCCPE